MAKVTITFEDIESEENGEGVEVNMVSDPPWPAPGEINPASMSAAQQMALEMTHILSERQMAEEHEHCHDENCTHDHHSHEV